MPDFGLLACRRCPREDVKPMDAYVETVGYATPRQRRGGQSGSSLVARRATGKYLCARCVVELQAGAEWDAPGRGRNVQESLL